MKAVQLGVIVVAAFAAIPCVTSAQGQRGQAGAAPPISFRDLNVIETFGGSLTGADMDARATMVGPLVVGAPYSAHGTTEFLETLNDGTHIKREWAFTIARDSAGRLRREADDGVWISDPVTQVSYVLRPSDRTARELPLASGGRGGRGMLPGSPGAAGAPVVAGGGRGGRGAGAPGGRGGGAATAPDPAVIQPRLDTYTLRMVPARRGRGATQPTPTSLGTRTIEGVTATGTRSATTIAAGSIGNDKDIVISDESWYSEDLHVVVMSESKDPRSGNTTFKLTGIKRTEPDHSLFMVPPGYTIVQNGRGGQ